MVSFMPKKHYYSILDWANKKEWEEYAKKIISEKRGRVPENEILHDILNFNFKFELIEQ